MTPFGDRLLEAVRRAGSPACVGIDPFADRLPAPLQSDHPRALAAAYRAFGLGVVRACTGVVPAVKPQVAFFEALGHAGVAALEDVVLAARAAGLVVVLDAKRGDIGSTAEAYAHATLDDTGPLGADAVTVSPYLGPESLAPFIARTAAGKGVFVLLRTSNPGAGAWQLAGTPSIASRVAELVGAAAPGASGLSSVGAVVGATLPGEGRPWRERLPHAWMLVPGYGAQGGTLDAVRELLRPDGTGALVVSARAVLYPASGTDGDDWEPAIAARARAFAAELGAL